MALYGFLEEIGLPRRLGERVEELRRRGEPALAEEYRQLWEILCGGLEQCAALTGEVPMELEEFSSLFQLVLSQYDVGTIPVSLDRVTAGETTRQAGHRVKVLFLLGADDSSIPQVGAEPGLLSDDDRTLLASYGLELNQSAEERLYREMTTLYQICALPSRRLILTWPAQGAGGEERRSCFLVGRLKLLFPGLAEVREEGLGDSFRMAAPLPALELAGRSPAVRRVMGSLPEYAPQVERLERAGRWERGRLTRGAVDRLYGQRVPMSASRMDKYKSCHFSYFMRYGLQAEPRKPAGFTAPEYGTFVHYVLEHVLQSCPIGEESWGEELQKRLRAAVRAAVDRYTAEELTRTEATGFGLCYFGAAYLADHGQSFQGKKVIISGSGNVATYANQKCTEMGATVVAMSDSNGYVVDENGIDFRIIQQIKEQKRERISTYPNYVPTAKYVEGCAGIWSVPCDIAMPCATQNEIDTDSAKLLVSNGCKAVFEGSNMPCTPEAIQAIKASGLLYSPSKASNAGGVAVSGLEMSQNSERLYWTFEAVDAKLKEIMENIYRQCADTAAKYGQEGDIQAGANIVSFLKVADAMLWQGVY